MVGERDREQQDAVRWEQIDDAAISIPPPFNSTYNGTIPHNHRHHHQQQHNLQQQQQYAAMLAGAGADGGMGIMSDDMASQWDDEQMGLMGDSMASAGMEKGVRFPMSPTHDEAGGFFNGQLSQAPLQSVHSR